MNELLGKANDSSSSSNNNNNVLFYVLFLCVSTQPITNRQTKRSLKQTSVSTRTHATHKRMHALGLEEVDTHRRSVKHCCSVTEI